MGLGSWVIGSTGLVVFVRRVRSLSTGLRGKSFTCLNKMFNSKLTLFHFRRTILNFARFSAKRITRFVTISHGPMIFLYHSRILFFRTPRIRIITVDRPRITRVNPRSRFRFLYTRFLILGLCPNVPLFTFPIRAIRCISTSHRPMIRTRTTLRINHSCLMPIHHMTMSNVRFSVQVIATLSLFMIRLKGRLILLNSRRE